MHAGTSRDRRVCNRARGCREGLANSTFGTSRPRKTAKNCQSKAVIASASTSFRALPRAPSDTRHGGGIAHPHAHAFAGELGQPQRVGVTASSRESVSPEREQDVGNTLIPTGRFGFPTQAVLAAVQAQGEQDTEGPPPPSPPPEFAGVFKQRIKPKLPLDQVVMMHQAYVEANPLPKSWDEGPPLDNGGASAGATSDAKGEHKKVAAPPKADKKESPVSPRKRKVPAAKKAPEVTRRVSRRLQAKNGGK